MRKNMTDADFPEELQRFIETCLPTVDAMELLLLLARHRERLWRYEELMSELRPTAAVQPPRSESISSFSRRGA